MNKKIPYLIRVNLPNEIQYEKLHLYTLKEDAENGYEFSEYDKQLYCAIKIKQDGINSLTEDVKNYCVKGGNLIDTVRFQKIRLEKIAKKQITIEDNLFFDSHLKGKISIRDSIITKEIRRTGISTKKISPITSNYLETLLSFVRKIDDEIILIRWFIHIKLSFENCVHIFIKHVEETKFASGAFAKRTLFKYEFEEIFTLLKVILKQEKKIKGHFLKVAVGKQINQQDLIKNYLNNWIHYNDDIFTLAIDTEGYITKFHQKN